MRKNISVDVGSLKLKQRCYESICVPIVVVWLGCWNPADANEGNSRGAALYNENCLVCHGEDGGGAMPGVSDLTEKRSWSTVSERQLLERIQQGIQSPGAAVTMPPRGGNPDLTDQDLLQIIHFMKVSFLP